MKTTKFKFNLDAIVHLTNCHINKKNPNLKLLEKYTSFGSVEYFSIPIKIKDFINDPRLLDQYNFKNKDQEYFYSFFKKIVELTSLDRAENLKKQLSKSWSTAYYTPQSIVDLKMYHIIKNDANRINTINKDHNPYVILDPSCGNGHYLKAIRRAFQKLRSEKIINEEYTTLIKKRKVIIEAIEIEPIAYYVTKRLYPEVHLHFTPFQNTSLLFKEYDLIASNIPFSKSKIQLLQQQDQDILKDKGKINLQQYYFYKGSSLLKEKGKLAYITSSVIADSNVYDDLRSYLVHHNDLLINIRLPNSTFDNTQVVSDCIVFEKNSNKKYLSNKEERYTYIGLKKLEESNTEFKFNDFFLYYSDYLMGTLGTNRMHGKESITLYYKNSIESLVKTIKDKKLFEIESSPIVGKEINKDKQGEIKIIQSGQLDLFENVVNETILKTKHKVYDVGFLEKHSIGSEKLLFFEGKFGYFSSEVNNQDRFVFNEIKTTISNEEKNLLLNIIKSFDEIYFSYKDSTYHKQRKESHKNLIQSYNELTTQYNSLYFYKDQLLIDCLGEEIIKLETLKNDQVIKSDLLSDINFFDKAITKKLHSYQDAIMASLNRNNTLDFEFIKNVLELDVTLEELKKDLTIKGYIYLEINSDKKSQYVLKDVFLSGNIYSKIDLLQDYYKDLMPSWYSNEIHSKQLNLLNESKNPWIEFDHINIQLGNAWIDKSYFETFIAENLFGLSYSSDITLSQFKSNSIYKIIPTRDLSRYQYINQKYSIRRFGREEGRLIMNPIQLVESCLNNITPTFSYKEEKKDGSGKFETKKDIRAFKLAQYKIKQIENEWKTFLSSLPVEDKMKIEKQYNYRLNNYVEREIRGSHLEFNLSGGIKLRDHQKDAVYKIIEDGGAIIDHKVGAGKTFTMITASKKMKELGLIKKPVIACLKANVREIYREYKVLYPDAKILFEEPNLTNKEKRKDYFSKIAHNDWDCIIMKHDTLSRIPIPEETEKEYLEEQIENLNHDFNILNSSEEGKPSKRQLKGLQERIENTELRIQYLTQYLKDHADTLIYNIATLGIDHLFIDESHHFKNVGFNSVHMNVAGLGTRKGSKKAVNLKMQIMTLHKKYGFDKGITFCTGTVISNSMVELYNVLNMKAPSEMQSLDIKTFDSFAKLFAIKNSDYEMSVTGDVKIKERFRNFVNVPELIKLYKKHAHIINSHNFTVERPDLKNELIEIDPNDLQLNFNDKLVEFVEEENGQLLSGITGRIYSEDQMNAKMLLCTNLSKKASIDMRLVNSSFPKQENGKLDILCKKLSEIYYKFNEDKGVQIVFSDIGTPNRNEDRFSVYDEIRNSLVAKFNIPMKEIAFIHEHDSTLHKKQAFFNEVNKGNYRIIIGSTSKLGTGVNIQKRCTALHHIDIPWRPSDMEQRNGRGARQGNWLAKEKNNNVVNSYIYATKKSLDAYNFQILAHKDEFIHQIKNGSVSQRTFNEGDIGENGEVSYAVLSACVSGNTELLEKIKLEKKLERLEDEKLFKTNQIAKAKSNIEYYTDKNRELEKQIENLDKVKPQVEKNFGNYYKEEVKELLPPILDKEGVEIPSKEVDKIIQERYLNGILSIDFFQNRDKLFSQGDYSLFLEKKTFINEKPKMEIIIRDDVNDLSYKRRSNIIPKKDVIKIIPERLKNLEKSIFNKKDEIQDNKSIINKNQKILNSVSVSKGTEQKINILKNEIKRLEKIVLSQTKEKKKRKNIKL